MDFTIPHALMVPFTPAGSVSAVNVQAAIEEVDSEKLALAGGSMTGDIDMQGNKILSNSGTVTLGGTGGTHNETIQFNFEYAANKINLTTTSGATTLTTELNFNFHDLRTFTFGTGSDCYFLWSTYNNHFLNLGLRVNSSTRTGHFCIMEAGKHGSANRSPFPTAYPTIRVYGPGNSDANDYVDVYHDQTDGRFDVGNGNAKFNANIDLDSNNLLNGGTAAFSGQVTVTDAAGNNMIEVVEDKIGLYGETAVVQAGHIADPAGGATQDAEARTAINAILVAIENIGITAAA
jgi:hypothetical protein